MYKPPLTHTSIYIAIILSLWNPETDLKEILLVILHIRATKLGRNILNKLYKYNHT